MKALLLLLLCSLQLAPSIGGHDDVAKSTARALCIGGGAFANQPAAAAADSSTGSDQHNIKLVASITELGKHLAALDGKAQHVLSLWCNQHLHASTPASPTNAPPSASDHAAEGKKKKVKEECSNSGGGSEKEPKLSEESVEAELASIVNLLGNRAARPSGEAQQEAHMLLANLLQQDMVGDPGDVVLLKAWSARHSNADVLTPQPATDTDLTAPRSVIEGGLSYGAPPELAVDQTGVFQKDLQCLRPVLKKHQKHQYNEHLLRVPKEPKRLCSGSASRCGGRCQMYVEDAAVSLAEAAGLIDHARFVAEVIAKKKKAKNAKKKEKKKAASSNNAPSIGGSGRGGGGQEQHVHHRGASAVAVDGVKEVEEDHEPEQKLMIDIARSAQHGGMHGHILLLRVLERIRRLAAVTFEVDRSRIRFSSHFVSKITAERAATDSAVHSDESSFGTFHFSAVLWLNTYKADFDGGRIVFFDGANGTEPWVRVQPKAGRLALFTSGWENAHRVEPVVGGERWSIPVFMEVTPDPVAPWEDFVSLCATPKSTVAVEACTAFWPALFDGP